MTVGPTTMTVGEGNGHPCSAAAASDQDLAPGGYFVEAVVGGADPRSACFDDCNPTIEVFGASVGGIDIDLESTPPTPTPTPTPSVGTGGIAGTVIIDEQLPTEPVDVCINGPVFACTFTDPAGEYAFGELPAGEYTVEILTPFQNVGLWCYDGASSSPNCDRFLPVIVGNSGVVGIDFDASAIGAIVGATVPAEPGLEVCATGVDVSVFACGTTDDLGRFVIRDLPDGRYQVGGGFGDGPEVVVDSPFVSDAGSIQIPV